MLLSMNYLYKEFILYSAYQNFKYTWCNENFALIERTKEASSDLK